MTACPIDSALAALDRTREASAALLATIQAEISRAKVAPVAPRGSSGAGLDHPRTRSRIAAWICSSSERSKRAPCLSLTRRPSMA